MRVKIPFIFIAGLLVCSQYTLAQAISQGVLLNQQSMQNAGNANMQSPRTVQPSSSHAAGQDAQPATFDPYATPRGFDDSGRSRQPFLSEYAGYLTPGVALTISSPDPSAVIYYTIDGWTPTQDSLRYVNPITINHDMRVQAFAVEPGRSPSPIVDATYILKPQPPLLPKIKIIDDNALHQGTALRLVTGTDARSDTAQVGDTLLLKLDENVMVGNTIVAAKGSLGKATLTRVESAARGGKPGVISFKVESLDVHGVSVPLNVSLTLAAPDVAAQAAKISNPSVVHISGTLPKGDEAVIEPGMPLTAIVSADTSLR